LSERPRGADDVRAIVLDFDGVIADSEALANRVLAEALTEIGLATTYEDALTLYCGRRWAECAAEIAARFGGPLPSGFIERCMARVDEAFVREVTPVAGVGEFLSRTAHLPRAIASSSRIDWLERGLARLGFGEHFTGRLFSASELARGKPHPDIYLHAARGLATPPEACLAIEDSPVGVAAAVSAGMRVVGLVAGSHIRTGDDARLAAAGAHHVARSFDEVAALIHDANR
jgi:beta-phosphoglucomutase-like phosphatase (HAD superfamily)